MKNTYFVDAVVWRDQKGPTVPAAIGVLTINGVEMEVVVTVFGCILELSILDLFMAKQQLASMNK